MSNGCGPKNWPMWLKNLLFNWFFKSPCDDHDNDYEIGGNEEMRKHYDKKFLSSMLVSVKSVRWYFVPIALVMAYSFYAAVRIRGRSRFNYHAK